jgi:beta-lactamase class A
MPRLQLLDQKSILLPKSKIGGTPRGPEPSVIRGQGYAKGYCRDVRSCFPGRIPLLHFIYLKGVLPSGNVVAHKTGSTDTMNGLTAATNDNGVIFLPNGGQLAISVYVKASTRNDAERDYVIAQTALAAFEKFKANLISLPTKT